MKNLTPEKKVTWIIRIAIILFLIPLIALQIYVCKTYNIPGPVGFICIIPIFWGLMALLYKWLEKSKWKETLEKMGQKIEEEEEKNIPRAKPRIFSIALMSLILLIYAIVYGIDIAKDIIANYTQGVNYTEILPDVINILTLMICCICIGGIAYNVKKGKLFSYINANLIYTVGWTLFLSVTTQQHYWDTTTMIPNDSVRNYYYLFSIFILFFGRLFSICVKMKEEQDLTI
jgi:hypothetical protein